MLRVRFLLRPITRNSVPILDFQTSIFVPPVISRPWEESLISFFWFPSLFAFRYLFQPSDSLYIGNGKIHLPLEASCTFTSRGGVRTGTSRGSVHMLEISPSAFLSVACSYSHTIKLHLSASCLLWAGLISLVLPQFTRCSGIFKLKEAFWAVNYFAMMFLFILYHKTFSSKENHKGKGYQVKLNAFNCWSKESAVKLLLNKIEK